MKRKNSGFYPGALQHIYQRAIDRGVIFYTIEDRLVYYTLAASYAKRHNVKVYSASVMFTHLHQVVRSPSLSVLRAYLRDINSSFSRLYNSHYGRVGRLFEKPPGISQKENSKAGRTSLIYVFNNHVEKRLCKRAVDERWSLLSYALSDHPFSETVDFKNASKTLVKAIRLVDRRIRKLKGLEYVDLDKILPNLNMTEHEQFIDYVIYRYAWIDFDAAASLFNDIDKMIMAIDSSTGSEYGIKEEYSSLSDKPYLELTDIARSKGVLGKIYRLSPYEKASLIMATGRITSAHRYHLCKFFHEEIINI